MNIKIWIVFRVILIVGCFAAATLAYTIDPWNGWTFFAAFCSIPYFYFQTKEEMEGVL